MRVFSSWCQVHIDYGLIVTLPFERIGSGAFDYDFGALDGADNPLTKSYTNVMYDHQYSGSGI